MRTIVYDTDTLLAAERRNPDFLALHDELTAAHIRPIVPVVVLAQAWRGGWQHQISRVLKGCDILPSGQRTGRARGHRRGGVDCERADHWVIGARSVNMAQGLGRQSRSRRACDVSNQRLRLCR